jgi:hypothetical protein
MLRSHVVIIQILFGVLQNYGRCSARAKLAPVSQQSSTPSGLHSYIGAGQNDEYPEQSSKEEKSNTVTERAK